MNYIIIDTQLFSLLDSIFPDISVTKIRVKNLTNTYIIESNDEKIFYLENGSLNVNPNFIESLHNFAPIKIDKGIAIAIAKWIRSKTGLKSKVVCIGSEEYNIGGSLNESFDKLRARRLIHIAETYFNDLNPNDICDYWTTNEVDNYVNETMSEIVGAITSEYPYISSEEWFKVYDGIYDLLDSIGYSKKIRDFFNDSHEQC